MYGEQLNTPPPPTTTTTHTHTPKRSYKQNSSLRNFPSYLKSIRMLNIIFIFNRSQCSSAAVAIAKYECFKRSNRYYICSLIYNIKMHNIFRKCYLNWHERIDFIVSKSNEYLVGVGMEIYCAFRHLKLLKPESNDHHQPCHWLCKMNRPFSSLKDKTKYLRGLEIIQKLNTFYFP